MKLQIGGYCVKGGGHIWTYKKGADGCSGWDLFIEVEPEDIHLFPDWIQDLSRQREDDEWQNASGYWGQQAKLDRGDVIARSRINELEKALQQIYELKWSDDLEQMQHWVARLAAGGLYRSTASKTQGGKEVDQRIRGLISSYIAGVINASELNDGLPDMWTMDQAGDSEAMGLFMHVIGLLAGYQAGDRSEEELRTALKELRRGNGKDDSDQAPVQH